MQVELTDSERRALRQLQKQRRDDAGYVKVTVMLMLDSGWPIGSVAEALGLDEAPLYRYARAYADLGLEKYLAHERPGYWGLLSSAQLAALCHEVNTTRYTDVKARQSWLAGANLRCAVCPLGPDGLAAPAGLHLQAHYACALPSRCTGAGRFPRLSRPARAIH